MPVFSELRVIKSLQSLPEKALPSYTEPDDFSKPLKWMDFYKALEI
jgi:hypothetical protein